jgi:hypothetical protein
MQIEATWGIQSTPFRMAKIKSLIVSSVKKVVETIMWKMVYPFWRTVWQFPIGCDHQLYATAIPLLRIYPTYKKTRSYNVFYTGVHDSFVYKNPTLNLNLYEHVCSIIAIQNVFPYGNGLPLFLFFPKNIVAINM